MKNQILIRSLFSFDDIDIARELIDLVWPLKSGTNLQSNMLKALIHSGSYLSGAFYQGKMIGASLGFPAYSDSFHLHSHITAVLPEFRNRRVGYALKIDQWNWAKKHGYSRITWTFDPLVARNAKFNITTLGVDISNYYTNFYGEMHDLLNAGDESDRLMVSWPTDLDKPKTRELITYPKLDDILIETPEDIVTIRSKNQSESMKWRRKVREQFLSAFEKNGKVVGFSANNEYVVRI